MGKKVIIEHGSIDLALFGQPGVLKGNIAHILSEDDIGQLLQFTNGSPITLTLPSSKSAPTIPVGASATILQYGAGKVTVAGAAGVTVNAPGGLLGTSTRYAEIWVTKVDTDNWVVNGSVG